MGQLIREDCKSSMEVLGQSQTKHELNENWREGDVLSMPQQHRGRRGRELNNRFHREVGPCVDVCS